MGDHAGSTHGRFRRAISGGSLLLAEVSARELGYLDLNDALDLISLYAAEQPEKVERAIVRWLGRLALERRVGLREMQAAAGAAAVLVDDPDPAVALLRRLAGRPTRGEMSNARASSASGARRAPQGR